ncbi:aquaporin-like protein [Tilletiopsis washingtonensis]|uniref:Aquaporin-like protein n=1 Tax=Tilletiopsis washingtonensis TaxID=58919 RepID=A0A316ZF79_9BASI|nr:aquaporin-like protein [Tilletiopsis washingtonensis]PWN99694.1 aquaporin-like protein [Tilletiopsis washingtonensis]
MPAAPVPASLPTPTHRARWAGYAGKQHRLWRARAALREELAEFAGTAMIIIFGVGVECEVELHMAVHSGPDAAKSLMSRFAWATGVAIGIWVAGGISGAHLNPTVTISLAMFRGFPMRKVGRYILAQILGACFGAFLIYANYHHSIERVEGGAQRTVYGPDATASLFFTFPQPYLPWTASFYSEFLASGVLLCAVFALSDSRNLAPPLGLMPLAMWMLLVGIGASLGINTGYAMNFARDTGPRIACWLLGYGNEVWTDHGYYFAWGPGIASVFGGLAGSAFYDLLISGPREDSPINRPRGRRAQGAADDSDEEQELA